MVDVQIINRKAFLQGQLELYKVRFIETDDNSYLEAMNETNKALDLIRNLETFISRVTKELREAKAELEILKVESSDVNNFFVVDNVRFEIIKTTISEGVLEIKNTINGKKSNINYSKYIRILKNSK